MVDIYFDGGTSLHQTCVYDRKVDKYFNYEYSRDMCYTNNQLEYLALIDAVEYAVYRYPDLKGVQFIGDSLLIINHMNGTYKVKSKNLKPLYRKAVKLIIDAYGSKQITHLIKWVPREENEAGIELERIEY